MDFSALLSQMPVWARATPIRLADAEALRSQWDALWNPEPSLTLWTTPFGDDKANEIPQVIPTLEDHHPHLSCVRCFGVLLSTHLTENMAALGYRPLCKASSLGVGFAKKFELLEDVRVLHLDAHSWETADDFYSGFFAAVGAPSWHGRDFDALIDSIQTGGINQIEVAYRIVIRNAANRNSAVQAILKEFTELVRQMQANGCPVDLALMNN